MLSIGKDPEGAALTEKGAITIFIKTIKRWVDGLPYGYGSESAVHSSARETAGSLSVVQGRCPSPLSRAYL